MIWMRVRPRRAAKVWAAKVWAAKVWAAKVWAIAGAALLASFATTPLDVTAQEDAAAAQWKPVQVPDVWKRPPGEIARDGGGYVWYRCRVALPEAWRGQPLKLYAEAADDARQYFVGGRQVGQMGQFPPRFRTGLGEEARYDVPAEATDAAELTVAIRAFQKEARSNFNVAPPVLFGKQQAIRLRGPWEAHFGDLPREQSVAAATSPPLDQVITAEEAERTLKLLEGDEGPLPVAETVRRITSPDDLRIDCPLAEPHIGQPLQIKFDERGRMWVVNYLQYPTPAGLTIVSRDKYLRAVYDRLPAPPPNHFPGADKITIHEDTDGDGKYDRHKTFVDNLSLCTSLAIGRGGVYVLNPPYLLFYADADGDDVPDGDPEVLLEGFNLEDTHSICNSLRWGPDGWLYAAQGSTVTGNVRRYGSDDKPVHSMGQLIWRYHPQQKRYEIFAEGGGNTFGVELDAEGRIYSGHNGGDTRGFHYVQGGYYRKGFGKHGELSNPYTFGYFPHIPHHSVPRFTHNFVIYEGGALPRGYDGRLFGVAPLQGHVVMSEVSPRGSTFQTKDVGHPLDASDTWVRPVEIRVGPDGAIYVADFYEQRIDHASHHQGRVHKESGRIYRIRAADADPEPAVDLGRLSSADLMGQLEHPNKWRRQQALRLLGDRRDGSLVAPLRQRLADESGQTALELLWALNLSGGLDEPTAIQLLEHPEPQVRLWTVRLLCDEPGLTGEPLSAEVSQRLASMAGREQDVHARCQLACSARRLPVHQSQPILLGLLRHDEDRADPYIPLLLWWCLENQVGQDRAAVVELFRDKALWQRPLVREHLVARLARRLAAAGARQDLLACAELLNAAPDEASVAELMKGIDEAFAGRVVRGLPEPLLRAMASRGKASLAFRVRQGDAEALEEAVNKVRRVEGDLAERLLLIEVFGQVAQPQLADVLLELAETAPRDEVRAAALNALQAYDTPEIAARVIQLHNQVSDDVRDVARSLLASRPQWTRQYLQAVAQGQLRPDDVPLPVVRRLLLHDDQEIAALVRKHWGDVQGATSEEMLERISLYKRWIAEATGNPYDGKRLFAENCGKCHQLFASGGKIGPDLTAYKRDDLHSMLLNVVNPSLEIREGFESFMVLTEDGRRLTGFIEDQDQQVVVLKKADGQTSVIPRDEIARMKAVPVSIMPQGVLDQLTEQEVRDLFAYLRSTQPLP